MNDTNTLFHCVFCEYTTTRKSDYTKHLSTRKHQKHENKNKFTENMSSIHKLMTINEEILINENELESVIFDDLDNSYDEETDNILFCSCRKQYSSRQSLHVHQKKCRRKNIDNILNNNLNFINVNEGIIIELIKDNRELKELLIEQNKTIQEIVKNNSLCMSNNITNNSNNVNCIVALNEYKYTKCTYETSLLLSFTLARPPYSSINSLIFPALIFQII